jgi:hypothetical protein
MTGRSIQLTGEIARIEETVDIATSSPWIRRKRDPSGVPTMQKSGVRSIALQDMIWRSARLFWITRRCRHQQRQHLKIPIGVSIVEMILTTMSI